MKRTDELAHQRDMALIPQQRINERVLDILLDVPVDQNPLEQREHQLVETRGVVQVKRLNNWNQTALHLFPTNTKNRFHYH